MGKSGAGAKKRMQIEKYIRENDSKQVIRSEILSNNSLTSHIKTFYKWISGLRSIAATNRTMMEDFALRIYSTNSGTWVYTFLVYASSIASTFRANYAFWST